MPAKTLTEQGAAAHMSKLLDVVKALTPEGPGICWHMTAETLTEQGAATHIAAIARLRNGGSWFSLAKAQKRSGSHLPPAPRGVLQEVPRGVPAKTPG